MLFRSSLLLGLVAVFTAVKATESHHSTPYSDLVSRDKPSFASNHELKAGAIYPVVSKRDNPPSQADFDTFFGSLGAFKSGRVLFWSGTTAQTAQEFAESHGRYTIQMLLPDKWNMYTTTKANGGYWGSAQDLQQNFWDPASRSLANWATGDAWLYVTQEAAVDQTNPGCTRCWYDVEKPILIGKLGNGIDNIMMYQLPADRNTEREVFVKYIRVLTDKRDFLASTWVA